MYGLMPKKLLGGEDFHFCATRHSLRGRDSGKTYRCGNTIFCRVHETDVVKGTLLLRPSGIKAPAAKAESGPAKREGKRRPRPERSDD